MKQQLLLKWCITIVAVLVSYTTANAANIIGNGTGNGIKFELYDDNTAKVVGYTSELPARVVVPEYVRLDSVELFSVTSIGYGAFRDCNSLQSVEMNSVTSIGEYAFYGCSSLQSIQMNSVTSIGAYAFNDCYSLQSVEMDRVISIRNRAFALCLSLRTILLMNPNPPNIGYDTFYDVSNVVVTIPFNSRAKYIEDWGINPGYGAGFTYKCIDVEDIAKNIKISNTAGQLMNHIDINELQNIWSLTLSGEINGSDLNVINRMENLVRLDLSNCHIVSGGVSYYKNNDKEYYTTDNILGANSIRLITLDSISYPKVINVEADAVTKAPLLSQAIIPATVTTFSNTTSFREYFFLYGDDEIQTSTNANSISGARKVWLGRPISNMSFFSGVTGTLKEVTIAYPYTEFADKLFYNCSKLTSFKIPSSVQKIGVRTFYGCTGLKEVICCAQTPPSANENSFSSSTYQNATLYVPVGTRNAYFFDPVWGMFTNIVESEELTDGVGDVIAEDVDGPISVYDLQGVQRYHGDRDAMPTLPHGIYIILNGNGKAEKVAM